jgi:hypothetical protein
MLKRTEKSLQRHKNLQKSTDLPKQRALSEQDRAQGLQRHERRSSVTHYKIYIYLERDKNDGAREADFAVARERRGETLAYLACYSVFFFFNILFGFLEGGTLLKLRLF